MILTPKERLANVIHRQKVDRPPCICPGGMMNMITSQLLESLNFSEMEQVHTDPEKMAQLASGVYEQHCFENYGVPFCMTVEAEALGAKVNYGTIIYEPHVVKYVIDSVEEYQTLSHIDCSKGRVKTVLDAISILKEKGTDVPIIGNLTGPISTASSIIEPVIFYKELRKKNKAAHEYMNFITQQLIVFGREEIAHGADMIAISDPSGTGEILGPKFFEEFAVTYINQLLDGLQAEKTGTIVHICGQMHSVYEQIAKVHSDVLSFDSIVPMKEAKEKLPNRLIMGNVSTYTVEFGDPQKVSELTKYCLKNGSDIIAPACGLGMKSPLTNVQAMLAGLKEEYDNV